MPVTPLRGAAGCLLSFGDQTEDQLCPQGLLFGVALCEHLPMQQPGFLSPFRLPQGIGQIHLRELRSILPGGVERHLQGDERIVAKEEFDHLDGVSETDRPGAGFRRTRWF